MFTEYEKMHFIHFAHDASLATQITDETALGGSWCVFVDFQFRFVLILEWEGTWGCGKEQQLSVHLKYCTEQ